ncbi:MAG: hypothetical protein IPO88_25100 [Nannocystis sp.]|nr:hypothetical protein [Nannocystis sp.]
MLRHSEHLLAATLFPEFAVPTVHCPDLPALLRAVRAQPLEAVVKPLGECSGRGIAFFPPLAPEAELAAYWAAHADTSGVVVQPFQPAISTRGDLRILVMNRRILGSVARIPGPGSRLANLHQGASVRAFDPTPRQLAAVAAVADALSPRGLHLLGLDFIGDLLSEINFTSPSALVQINEVMHKRAEQELVDDRRHEPDARHGLECRDRAARRAPPRRARCGMMRGRPLHAPRRPQRPRRGRAACDGCTCPFRQPRPPRRRRSDLRGHDRRRDLAPRDRSQRRVQARRRRHAPPRRPQGRALPRPRHRRRRQPVDRPHGSHGPEARGPAVKTPNFASIRPPQPVLASEPIDRRQRVAARLPSGHENSGLSPSPSPRPRRPPAPRLRR